jgi:hypothetical protein
MAAKGEKAWVDTLLPRLHRDLQACATGEICVGVEAGYRLAYANEISRYDWETDEAHPPHRPGYQTDLLVFDHAPDKTWWVPRVVIECKVVGVTTHDALTYSAKAATHKHVHPYLRYGILIGDYGTAVPSRLVRHGAFFDFMTIWRGPKPARVEWRELIDVLRSEIEASRTLQKVLGRRSKGGKRFRLLHRPLVLVESHRE